MTKQILEFLTQERIKESKILLDNKCYSGAYYLAGYSIECGINACIAKQINQHEVPSKLLINQFYVHDLEKLMKLAGIDSELEEKSKKDSEFKINWSIVKTWDESARYKEWTEIQAIEFYNAIYNKNDGVLLWIQQYW